MALKAVELRRAANTAYIYVIETELRKKSDVARHLADVDAALKLASANSDSRLAKARGGNCV